MSIESQCIRKCSCVVWTRESRCAAGMPALCLGALRISMCDCESCMCLSCAQRDAALTTYALRYVRYKTPFRTSFLPCSTSRSSKIPHAGCTVRRSDRWALPRPMRRRRVRRRRHHRRLPRDRRTSSSSTAYSSSSRASPVRSLEDTNESHAHMLCTPTLPGACHV